MKDKTGKGMTEMKKTYKIEVDCANCANKMEEAANKTEGVKKAVVNFMTLKMTVEFEEGVLLLDISIIEIQHGVIQIYPLEPQCFSIMEAMIMNI